MNVPPHAVRIWPQGDLECARAELAKEYPVVPAAVIAAAVNQAEEESPPPMGLVKLLELARCHLRSALSKAAPSR